MALTRRGNCQGRCAVGGVRYLGVPRSVLHGVVADMPGWRILGERIRQRAMIICPVSTGNDNEDEHLRDTLVVKFISGGDPRILVGSTRKGDVFSYVTLGTEPHPIDPVNASLLRFTAGGTVVFAHHVEHPGHPEPNDFVTLAARQVLNQT